MIELPLPSGHIVIIDDDSTDLVAGLRWYAMKRGPLVYAESDPRTLPRVRMHRLILGAPPGAIVDHINGNGLDNRRSNLRLCTATQNVMNAGPKRTWKRFKGVFYARDRQSWWAQIAVDRRRFFGGYHDTEEAAARAYDRMAVLHHGEFARLNFPQDGPALNVAAGPSSIRPAAAAAPPNKIPAVAPDRDIAVDRGAP